MKRTLTTTRIFALGNYQNIQLTDTIEDIPEELALNHEFIETLSKLQLLRIESQFTTYSMLREKTRGIQTLEEVSFLLEEERKATIASLGKNSEAINKVFEE